MSQHCSKHFRALTHLILLVALGGKAGSEGARQQGEWRHQDFNQCTVEKDEAAPHWSFSNRCCEHLRQGGEHTHTSAELCPRKTMQTQGGPRSVLGETPRGQRGEAKWSTTALGEGRWGWSPWECVRGCRLLSAFQGRQSHLPKGTRRTSPPSYPLELQDRGDFTALAPCCTCRVCGSAQYTVGVQETFAVE